MAILGTSAILVALLPMMPQLLQMIMTVYQSASASPETPEEQRVHFARIAAALDAAGALVQQAPLPPPGSGR